MLVMPIFNRLFQCCYVVRCHVYNSLSLSMSFIIRCCSIFTLHAGQNIS
jgi:hypothetical protein